MAGLGTVSDDWQSITTDDIINGHKYNTDFVLGGYEPVYFIGDKSIKSSYSNDTIQNCTQILANLLRSNDNLTIKTFEATGENKYIVGKCSNIQYVARYIESKIESITSTSVCDIPLDVSEKIGKYDTRFTSNGLGGQLVCRITSNDIEYLRAFTISGQEITLLDTVTGATSAIASLAVDDRFELINAYDILEEGLEETTGYPVQGFVKKHVKPNEDTSFVEFGKYDTPAKLSGEKVVIAYNALDDYNQTFIYDSSIDQYGIFTKKEDLNFALTQSQLTYIETTLKKFIEPNIVIELETFRPSKPLKGWNVNVNIPELDLTGIFKITRVSEVFIYETGQLIDKPFRLWKVTLSNYENNLAQLLAGLKKKNDSKAKLATNQVLRTAMALDLQFKWIDDPSEFTLDAPTAYDATNVTADDFEANWSYVANANDYIIFVALDAGFTTPVSGFAGLLVGNVTTRLIDGQDVTDNDTFYYKVKAINTELGLESDWSDTLEINKRVEAYYFLTNETAGYEQIYSCDLDGTNKALFVSTTSTQRPIDVDANDDYVAYEMAGYIDIYGNRGIILINKNTNVTSVIDQNVYSYNVQKPKFRGNYLYYARNGNNIYKYNLGTGAYTSVYNASFSFEDVSHDERYLIGINSGTIYCYDTVTTAISNSVYHSWMKVRFLPNNKVLASDINGNTYLFNDVTNLSTSYSAIVSTTLGFVSDVISDTEFITSGAPYNNNKTVKHFDTSGNLLKTVTLVSGSLYAYNVIIAKKP